MAKLVKMGVVKKHAEEEKRSRLLNNDEARKEYQFIQRGKIASFLLNSIFDPPHARSSALHF